MSGLQDPIYLYMKMVLHLNQDWPIENGGLLHYFSKDANEWKIVKPDQGLLVYNDNNEQHYTTVSHEGHTRISLQMFGY